MAEAPIAVIDATVFMGMHHSDPEVRAKSLGFFGAFYSRQVMMSFGQIGICDAIIWKKSRHLQDVYYPFMDVLHTDMDIQRQGYCNKVLKRACLEPDWAHLSVEKRLLVAHVVEHQQPFYTHDDSLCELGLLKPFLKTFPSTTSPSVFPEKLQRLYEQSMEMSIAKEDFQHVG
ncbi:DUF6190 family protein [Pseudomonas sp. B21-028]|jgi:hypothetical protein|uniref:DUF6190 family protein n=1 Tax=Pseudomonas sp. B21-028 TaxID=2895480 RepID=UPI00216004E1|nr:DUF6190 family protein [Pseudomonas sp. B21-028]UVL84917.1 DUF6190 family protein [Pseudomonas sp. B21-028]